LHLDSRIIHFKALLQTSRCGLPVRTDYLLFPLDSPSFPSEYFEFPTLPRLELYHISECKTGRFYRVQALWKTVRSAEFIGVCR